MSSFYRLARPTLAAATATTAAALVTISSKRSEKYVADDGCGRPLGGSSGWFGNKYCYYSPAFALKSVALCEAPASNAPAYKPTDPAEPTADPVEISSSDGKKVQVKGGMWGEEEDGLYHGLFPRRQLWRPRLEYPLWDQNWDGRQPPPIPQVDEVDANTENPKQLMTEGQRERYIRKNGVTKHIILIRHGQYDESFKEDSMRLLTPLGRDQAALTGKRLGKLIRGVNEEFGPLKGSYEIVDYSGLLYCELTHYYHLIFSFFPTHSFTAKSTIRSSYPPSPSSFCRHVQS